MKTLRKIRKNAKALSPVVASIILIAVTVAVSIAVAAWMGALTVGFMATEEVKITNMMFPVGHVQVVANNTGTTPVTINEVWINGVKQTYTPQTLAANTGAVVDVSFTWVAGSNYQIKLISAKGNSFLYTAYAPA
jgi:archaeal type IV pilus assembly protein PilA